MDLKVSESQVRTGLTMPLDVVLEALARSLGLQPLIYRAYDPTGDPAKAQPPLPNVKLDFQGKPFREVWDLLFATYGTQFNLDYLFLPPDVVVVAPTQVITALVDAPSRTGAMERKPYLVAIPEIAYRRTETDAQGQARTVVNIDAAKAWVQNDLLPFLSREASGLSVNWIVVEEGGKLRALLSVLATPEQHIRFSDILQRAGIDFRPLPALTLPKPRVERSHVLTHSTFPGDPFLPANTGPERPSGRGSHRSQTGSHHCHRGGPRPHRRTPKGGRCTQAHPHGALGLHPAEPHFPGSPAKA